MLLQTLVCCFHSALLISGLTKGYVIRTVDSVKPQVTDEKVIGDHEFK